VGSFSSSSCCSQNPPVRDISGSLMDLHNLGDREKHP
jgi:hypothetical protein